MPDYSSGRYSEGIKGMTNAEKRILKEWYDGLANRDKDLVYKYVIYPYNKKFNNTDKKDNPFNSIKTERSDSKKPPT